MAAVKLSGQFMGSERRTRQETLMDTEVDHNTKTANKTFVLSPTQNIVFSKYRLGPLASCRIVTR